MVCKKSYFLIRPHSQVLGLRTPTFLGDGGGTVQSLTQNYSRSYPLTQRQGTAGPLTCKAGGPLTSFLPLPAHCMGPRSYGPKVRDEVPTTHWDLSSSVGVWRCSLLDCGMLAGGSVTAALVGLLPMPVPVIPVGSQPDLLFVTGFFPLSVSPEDLCSLQVGSTSSSACAPCHTPSKCLLKSCIIHFGFLCKQPRKNTSATSVHIK